MSQEALDNLQTFNFDTSTVFLWIFKPSSRDEKYSAHFIRTDESLETTLKSFATLERQRITEWSPYNYLAQCNENSCLSVGANETNFNALKTLVDRPEPDHAVSNVKQLRGATGYLVKFVHEEITIYAARRSPTTWKTAYRKKGVINVLFQNGELSASQGDEFTIEPNFDMFGVKDSILIANKGGFESVMQYRAGYAQAFSELQQQPEFSALFTTMQPLIAYVGSNSMQLRRMAVIQEKNLYSNPSFIAALKQVNANRNWGIIFDANDRISPTPETAAIIMKVLLDQRLLSEVTQIMYDVPDGIPVQ